MSVQFVSQPSSNISGEILIPGDKSISHRAIMLASIADGPSEISGFLAGEDCLATMAAFQKMGVSIIQEQGKLLVHGAGKYGLKQPESIIDCGNSGTSIRLFCGLLAGQSFDSELTGDISLQKRPMQRVMKPLTLMGAKIAAKEDNYPPLKIRGGRSLSAIQYSSPIASAQVKSALLLASLYAKGELIIDEPQTSRDHTELMLQSFGVKLQKMQNQIRIIGEQDLRGTHIEVPGDISSASFFIVAGLIMPQTTIKLLNVGVNPTRLGIIHLLRMMGADIKLLNQRLFNNELAADIEVKSSRLKGIEIPKDYIASAIDEFPVLLIAAANASGSTLLRNAHELRVKESDRLYAMAQGLKALGAKMVEYSDGIQIEGCQLSGGEVQSFHDHRIAMAFSIAGLRAQGAIKIYDCENVKTSFPNFIALAKSLGLAIEENT